MIRFKIIYLISQIYKFVTKKRKIQLFFLLVLMVISSFAEVISIALVLPFITAISNPQGLLNIEIIKYFSNEFNLSNSEIIQYLGYSLMIIVVISSILRSLTLLFNFKLGAIISTEIGCIAYKKTLYQNYETHITRNSSELIKKLTIDINNLESVFSAILNGLTYLIITFSIITYLSAINFKITLAIIFLLSFAYLIFVFFTRDILTINSKIISDKQQLQIKSIQETISSIREVIIDQRQKLVLNNYRKNENLIRKPYAQSRFLASLPKFYIEAIGILSILFLTINLNTEDQRGLSILAILATFALGAQKLLPAMQQLYSSQSIIRVFINSLKNILGLLNQKDLTNLVSRNSSPYILRKNISFNNVVFKYKKNKIILNDINFEISKGDCVGIIGETGSGKSTIIDILLALLIPINGKVLVDNKELNYLKNPEFVSSWQKSIAHVPQTIFLEDSTIKNNVALGIPENKINQALVEKVLNQAMLGELVKDLPNGIDTCVGERGVRLSGGQRQRIGIARALYKKANLLIFDEATSALDSVTERRVIKSILSLRKEITLIMIAHRTTTLKACNKILKVSNNNILLIKQ